MPKRVAIIRIKLGWSGLGRGERSRCDRLSIAEESRNDPYECHSTLSVFGAGDRSILLRVVDTTALTSPTTTRGLPGCFGGRMRTEEPKGEPRRGRGRSSRTRPTSDQQSQHSDRLPPHHAVTAPSALREGVYRKGRQAATSDSTSSSISISVSVASSPTRRLTAASAVNSAKPPSTTFVTVRIQNRSGPTALNPERVFLWVQHDSRRTDALSRVGRLHVRGRLVLPAVTI
jgi:hypothetical protein